MNIIKIRTDIYHIFEVGLRSEVNVRNIKVNIIESQGEGGAYKGEGGLTYGEGTQIMKGPLEE